ncbi:MAG: hypothetical protein WBB69_02925 [Anaerolineales bacterium]
MTVPAIFYSFLLASFLGSAFHLWKGGGGGRYLLMLILSWAGFFLGHLLGSYWDIQFLMIGPVFGGFGVLGSLLFLFLGNWFSQLDSL